MAILINDMEMPETCEYCPFHVYHSHGEYVCKATPLLYPMNLANSKGIRKNWCPLVETPEPCEDVKFWRKRAEYYSKMCFDLIADINKGVKIDSVEINEDGIKFTKKQQEPCEDAVSRQVAINRIDRIIEVNKLRPELVWFTPNGVKVLLSELPSVTPKAEQRWIPCSETVDIPDHEILACDKYGEEMFGYLAYEDEQWLCESDGCAMCDPIAWREKPEPYREESEEV